MPYTFSFQLVSCGLTFSRRGNGCAFQGQHFPRVARIGNSVARVPCHRRAAQRNIATPAKLDKPSRVSPGTYLIMLLLALACSSEETFVCHLIGRKPALHHDHGVHIHPGRWMQITGFVNNSALKSHTHIRTQSTATDRSVAWKASISDASPLLAGIVPLKATQKQLCSGTNTIRNKGGTSAPDESHAGSALNLHNYFRGWHQIG